LLDELLVYLSVSGVSFDEMSRGESFSVTKRWTSIFGRFASGSPHLHGGAAVARWLQVDETDLILLFLSSRIEAFPISTNHRANSAFTYRGNAIDLSNYHELEFALFPTSYAWTLVHTHEDGAMGGPYFIRADDLEETAPFDRGST